MNDSILNSIKKLLGIEESYTHFDVDLIMHINSVFTILNQLGVGEKAFSIKDSDSTWADFLGDNTEIEVIKTYMFMKVKQIFDPPLSSAVMESMNKLIAECEWRINVAVDPSKSEVPNE